MATTIHDKQLWMNIIIKKVKDLMGIYFVDRRQKAE